MRYRIGLLVYHGLPKVKMTGHLEGLESAVSERGGVFWIGRSGRWASVAV